MVKEVMACIMLLTDIKVNRTELVKVELEVKDSKAFDVAKQANDRRELVMRLLGGQDPLAVADRVFSRILEVYDQEPGKSQREKTLTKLLAYKEAAEKEFWRSNKKLIESVNAIMAAGEEYSKLKDVEHKMDRSYGNYDPHPKLDQYNKFKEEFDSFGFFINNTLAAYDRSVKRLAEQPQFSVKTVKPIKDQDHLELRLPFEIYAFSSTNLDGKGAVGIKTEIDKLVKIYNSELSKIKPIIDAFLGSLDTYNVNLFAVKEKVIKEFDKIMMHIKVLCKHSDVVDKIRSGYTENIKRVLADLPPALAAANKELTEEFENEVEYLTNLSQELKLKIKENNNEIEADLLNKIIEINQHFAKEITYQLDEWSLRPMIANKKSDEICKQYIKGLNWVSLYKGIVVPTIDPKFSPLPYELRFLKGTVANLKISLIEREKYKDTPLTIDVNACYFYLSSSFPHIHLREFNRLLIARDYSDCNRLDIMRIPFAKQTIDLGDGKLKEDMVIPSDLVDELLKQREKGIVHEVRECELFLVGGKRVVTRFILEATKEVKNII